MIQSHWQIVPDTIGPEAAQLVGSWFIVIVLGANRYPCDAVTSTFVFESRNNCDTL